MVYGIAILLKSRYDRLFLQPLREFGVSTDDYPRRVLQPQGSMRFNKVIMRIDKIKSMLQLPTVL